MANTAAVFDSDIEEGGSLYNGGADDSDAESLVDIQSPTDGYFEQRDIPQETYTRNPADPTTKAKEAATEQLRNRESEAGEFSTQQSQPERWPEVSTPLLDAGPAPPDYAAATAGQREQQQQAFGSDHPLVRNGLLPEHGAFGQRDQPQSMRDVAPEAPTTAVTETRGRSDSELADVEEQAHEETPLVSKSSLRARKSRRWARGLKSCTLFVGVLLLILLAIVLSRTVRKHDDQSGDGDPEKISPGPDNGGGGLGIPSHPWPSTRCDFKYDDDIEVFNLSASGRSFEFLELIDREDYRDLLPSDIKISGTIRILPLSEDHHSSDTDIRVAVHVATTGKIRIRDLNFARDGGSLQIYSPDIVNEGPDRAHECIDIAVGIQVKKGVKIRNWKTRTANLDVIVDEGIFGKDERDTSSLSDGLHIDGETDIYAIRGNVDMAYWQSRKTIIETNSGNIKGIYALRDLLSLSSKSGQINVEVDPKKSDDKYPAPAEFIMKSYSGKVHAEFPTNNDLKRQSSIPDRDYRARIDTKSGATSGTYILGKEAKFTTLSGDMDLAVMPYSANLSHSTLSTDSYSAKLKLEVFAPYHADSFEETCCEHRDGIIDSLTSKHKSTSGALKVKYPQEWEGRIDAATISGNIKLRGKDVWQTGDLDMKRRIGYKGVGHSVMKFDTMSGDVNVLIGEE